MDLLCTLRYVLYCEDIPEVKLLTRIAATLISAYSIFDVRKGRPVASKMDQHLNRQIPVQQTFDNVE